MTTTAPTHPLKNALVAKQVQARRAFSQKHIIASQWLAQHGLTLDQVRQHSTNLLAGATLSSALLLAAPVMPQLLNKKPQAAFVSQSLIKNLLQKLGKMGTNNQNDTNEISQEIKKLFGVKTEVELEQNRIPTNWGVIGLEQHLLRYPEDNLSEHTAFQQAGMAPKRGAFSYFFEEGVDEKDAIAREQFYIVLQTFLIPDWNKDWARLKQWYKYRKFLIINTENGRAVVAALGDSGPAVSTGKQFGGSPEVMAGLGLYPQKTKGNVLVLFIDDPNNEIPLGPIFPKN